MPSDLLEALAAQEHVFARKVLAEVGRRMKRNGLAESIVFDCITGEVKRSIGVLIEEEDYNAIMAAVEETDAE